MLRLGTLTSQGLLNPDSVDLGEITIGMDQ
jgi:hypothetical protein